jgi:hypothetical protein
LAKFKDTIRAANPVQEKEGQIETLDKNPIASIAAIAEGMDDQGTDEGWMKHKVKFKKRPQDFDPMSRDQDTYEYAVFDPRDKDRAALERNKQLIEKEKLERQQRRKLLEEDLDGALDVIVENMDYEEEMKHKAHRDEETKKKEAEQAQRRAEEEAEEEAAVSAAPAMSYGRMGGHTRYTAFGRMGSPTMQRSDSPDQDASEEPPAKRHKADSTSSSKSSKEATAL